MALGFQRKKARWRVGGDELTLGVRTLLAGRIELVRGRASGKSDLGAMLDIAIELEESGADIVELNPGPRTLASGIPDADSELPGLVPVLKKLSARLSVPISVATANAETARRAIGLGATIIHDFTGLAFDKDLAKVVNESNAGLVLGHMRGTPAQWSRMEPLTRLTDVVRTDLHASVWRGHQAGIEPQRIVLDPGFDHGKRGHENFNLLRAIGRLAAPGQGLQANLAGKRFLVESVRASADERAAALAVATALAVASGAHIVAAERPASLREAVSVLDRVYRGDEDEELLEDRAARPARTRQGASASPAPRS